MRKFLSLYLTFAMLLSLCTVVMAGGEEPTPVNDAPVIEKPVYITVTDESGTPKAGATVQVIDSDRTVVETVTNASETFTVFLPAGTYTLKITSAPEGFLVPLEDATITVELTEAEEKDDIPANTTHDHDHEFCNKEGHAGIEQYTVYDEGTEITAFCFNQNYDNPFSSAENAIASGQFDKYDPEDHLYKRLVGTPELLYDLAQCKWDGPDGEGITAQELYDHVLSIIYHRDYIKNKYGFDDVTTNYLTNMTIKQFTDGNMTTFKSTDENGNNLVLRRDNDGTTGPVVYDENGWYQWRLGGSVLGSVVGHTRGDNIPKNPNYVFPQDFKDAWKELLGMTDHPDDYYLYIYYPHNFISKEEAIASGETEWYFPGHYDPFWMYYANGTDQCLMSTFTVPPVRTTLNLRTATGIEITKTWADENDQDGLRPTAAEYVSMVKLLADNTDVTEAYADQRTVIDNGDDTYTVRFDNLPKLNEEKTEIVYTIKENPVAEYTADKDEVSHGGTITNTHEPETTEIEITKTWADADDQDGYRPTAEEYVSMVKLLADRKDVTETYANQRTVTDNGDNTYTVTFTHLQKFRNGGVEISYTIQELPVEHYTADREIASQGVTITNTHIPETTEIEITKTWADANDQDGYRPTADEYKAMVKLLADGKDVTADYADHCNVTDNGDGTYTVKFTELPQNRDGGTIINYSIRENPVPQYVADRDEVTDGETITNTHVPETTEIEITKTWADANDQDGYRPTAEEYKAMVKLLMDGKDVTESYADQRTITDNGDDTYTVKFSNLPKMSNGVEINYTIQELPVEHYTANREIASHGVTITNTHIPETTEIEITKTWADANDQDGYRPTADAYKAMVKLLSDGKDVTADYADRCSVIDNGDDTYTVKFTDLPQNRDGGTIINYSIREIPVPQYVADKDEVTIGETITNSHVPEITEIEIHKVWDDDGDRDGLRPDSITVNLLADGVIVDTVSVIPDEDGNWAYTFSDLTKFRDHGVEIVYTITEEPVVGYETTVDGFTITNKHEPELTTISVTKTWDDANDQDGLRPDSITVNLLADGIIAQTASVTPDEDGNWSYTFVELPKYRDQGVEIVYTITEEPVVGYETTVEGFVINNRHTPGLTNIPVTKTWDDADDQDGLRPENITLKLLADGIVVQTVNITPDENGNWAYTFVDLPMRSAGEDINYTVVEEPVAGYETAVDGYAIINKHEPEMIEIPVAKTWDDANDQDGLRPDSITVNLLADGVIIDTVSISPDEDGNWNYTFAELPKYRDHGVEIEYTVTEEPVVAYETTLDGFNFTNKHEPELTSIPVTKTWDDANDQDGLRPDSITVNLLADGVIVQTATVTPDEDGNWNYTFVELPKYRDHGVEIEYTVTEEPVVGYETAVGGFDITNHHTPGFTSIPVNKIWDDANNQDGLRPDSITVNLLADGVIVQTATVTPDEDGNWAYTFTDLPMKAEGKQIVYTVTEEPVSGYETVVDGYTITNRHAPQSTDVTVNKTWNDADNRYKSRPDSITVNLLADGQIIRTVKITPDKNGNWTYHFDDLPKNADGKEIIYTITEEPVKGYITTVDGYHLINSFTPPTGDDAHPAIWMVMMGVSLLGVAAVLYWKSRRQHED